MSPAELRLTECLADGSRNSREVLAEMTSSCYSAKQVRRAREKLGVVARRSGCRTAMRTMWCLPLPASPGITQASEHQVRERLRLAEGSPAADPQDGRRLAQDGPRDDISEAERARLVGRIEAFTKRGLGADEARHVALALVARDRCSVHALGSCSECQMWVRQECPVTPRPAADIHVCWYRRTATP